MAIMWSRLHADLGLEGLDGAVDRVLPESDGLDWNRDLPTPEVEAAREFCKDVAAMANTRGGSLSRFVAPTRETCSTRLVTRLIMRARMDW